MHLAWQGPLKRAGRKAHTSARAKRGLLFCSLFYGVCSDASPGSRRLPTPLMMNAADREALVFNKTRRKKRGNCALEKTTRRVERDVYRVRGEISNNNYRIFDSNRHVAVNSFWKTVHGGGKLWFLWRIANCALLGSCKLLDNDITKAGREL